MIVLTHRTTTTEPHRGYLFCPKILLPLVWLRHLYCQLPCTIIHWRRVHVTMLFRDEYGMKWKGKSRLLLNWKNESFSPLIVAGMMIVICYDYSWCHSTSSLSSFVTVHVKRGGGEVTTSICLTIFLPLTFSKKILHNKRTKIIKLGWNGRHDYMSGAVKTDTRARVTGSAGVITILLFFMKERTHIT